MALMDKHKQVKRQRLDRICEGKACYSQHLEIIIIIIIIPNNFVTHITYFFCTLRTVIGKCSKQRLFLNMIFLLKLSHTQVQLP